MAKKKESKKTLDEAVEKLEDVNVTDAAPEEVKEEVTEAPAEETKEEEVTEEEVKEEVIEEPAVEAVEEVTEEDQEIIDTAKVDDIIAEEVAADEKAEEVAETETVIPEPAFIENGDTKVDSFNAKSVTIDGKTYPINRAEHKCLVRGDFSVLKNIKK